MICWTLFCLTSFQIMFTKLVGTSFVFSKLFCWLLEGCKFMDVEANWLNSLCSIETVSVFFLFNYYYHSCFVSNCLLDMDPSVGSFFFLSTLKLHVVLNCLNLCHMICFDIKFKLCIECWAAIILFLWGHTNVEVRKLTLKIIETNNEYW